MNSGRDGMDESSHRRPMIAGVFITDEERETIERRLYNMGIDPMDIRPDHPPRALYENRPTAVAFYNHVIKLKGDEVIESFPMWCKRIGLPWQ